MDILKLLELWTGWHGMVPYDKNCPKKLVSSWGSCVYTAMVLCTEGGELGGGDAEALLQRAGRIGAACVQALSYGARTAAAGIEIIGRTGGELRAGDNDSLIRYGRLISEYKTA